MRTRLVQVRTNATLVSNTGLEAAYYSPPIPITVTIANTKEACNEDKGISTSPTPNAAATAVESEPEVQSTQVCSNLDRDEVTPDSYEDNDNSVNRIDAHANDGLSSENIINKIDGLLKSGSVSWLGIPMELGIFSRRIDSHKTEDGHAVETEVSYRINGTELVFKQLDDIRDYLRKENLDIPICYFCFDPEVIISQPLKKQEELNTKSIVINEDVSQGKERLPIQVVRFETLKPSNLTEYVQFPVLSEDIEQLYTFEHADDGFLECCDCLDDCADKLKCACFRRTLDNCSKTTRDTCGDDKIGYNNQRLDRSFLSGIYECNKLCKCNRHRCINRVVQNGMVCNLQIFMTKKKGWGVRALTDIPKGSFLCLYSGIIVSKVFADKVSEDFASKEWIFLCELRLGEEGKPGYEAEVVEPEPDISAISAPPATPSPLPLPNFAEEDTHTVNEVMETETESFIDISKPCEHPFSPLQLKILELAAKRIDFKVKSTLPDRFSIPLYPKGQTEEEDNFRSKRKRIIDENEAISAKRSSVGITPLNTTYVYRGDCEEHEIDIVTSKNAHPKLPNDAQERKKRATQSTTSKTLLTENQKDSENEKKLKQVHDLLHFTLFIDGFNGCNVGGYLNHSCSPNVFPQYVFWNCHDLRLPVIGFFADRNIRSGEELCWDYKYQPEVPLSDGDGVETRPIKLSKGKRLVSGTKKGNGVKKSTIQNLTKARIACHCNEVNCKGALVS